MTSEFSYSQEVDDLTNEIKNLSEENSRLRRAVEELVTLNEIALAISGSMDSEEIMRIIIRHSIRSFDAEQGDITLVDEHAHRLGKTLARSAIGTQDPSQVHLNQSIVEWMRTNKSPLLVNNPASDNRFSNVGWKECIHSIISAPLLVRSQLIGMITIYNKKGGTGFTEDDLRLLTIIASESAQVVENARLHHEEQELSDMRKEVDLAGKIQKKLLPKEHPTINNYGLFGRNISAHSVGGDYYDFIQIDDNRWAICLGDVSGKGMPASLLMSNLQAILRGQINYLPRPGSLLRDANRQIFHCTDCEKFATLFLGILDTESHTMRYSNAGHEHPILITPDCTFTRLTNGGIPLGIFQEQFYEEGSIEFMPGDKLIVFSDGIIDSRNQEDEPFGLHTLKKLLVENSKVSGDQLMESIFAASLNHNANQQLFDDMTMIVLSRIN
ncbi:SpoIIE family protein phosphatase [Balneolaceae bacterium YR4-1]|uniref:SpoIIE family protein phosphatase n=1 Tax=Halalkalibaculum roseum TaxID=2709311 RepID=A0A6M1SXQ9_9BACT|nr:GAF domain-containing SpoIIE family protein phosphatase [Halalkalibaculum roseum]NGP77832.1 SpoIIE family protein phosphatase [Halalkalibaculum roseum]